MTILSPLLKVLSVMPMATSPTNDHWFTMLKKFSGLRKSSLRIETVVMRRMRTRRGPRRGRRVRRRDVTGPW